MSTSLSNSEVFDVQVSFAWLSDCFVCPFLGVHTDPTSPFPTFWQDDLTCHFHSRGRNNHPLPSIPYLDMDWSWHTVGASLTVQKQDGTPERNMEASLFLASYVDAFCCLFDLCKFQNSFFQQKTAVLLVCSTCWLLSLFHLLRCDAPLPLSVNLWASRNSADSVSGGDNLEKTGDNPWPLNHRFAAVIRPRNMASTAEERGTVPQISGKMPVLRSGDGEGPAFSPTKRLEQLVTWSSPLLFDIQPNYVCKSRCVHFHKFQKWHPFSLYQHRPQPNDETIMSKSPK